MVVGCLCCDMSALVPLFSTFDVWWTYIFVRKCDDAIRHVMYDVYRCEVHIAFIWAFASVCTCGCLFVLCCDGFVCVLDRLLMCVHLERRTEFQ